MKPSKPVFRRISNSLKLNVLITPKPGAADRGACRLNQDDRPNHFTTAGAGEKIGVLVRGRRVIEEELQRNESMCDQLSEIAEEGAVQKGLTTPLALRSAVIMVLRSATADRQATHRFSKDGVMPVINYWSMP